MRTIKLRLWITKETTKETLDDVYHIFNSTYFAANVIVRNQFLNDRMKKDSLTKINLDLDIKYKINKLKLEIENEKDKIKKETLQAEFKNVTNRRHDEYLNRIDEYEKWCVGLYGVKENATCERMIKEKYPHLPSCVTNRLTNDICSSYKKSIPKIARGEETVRTYKKGYPTPVRKSSITFIEDGQDHYIKWTIDGNRFIVFSVYYGKDKGNFKHTVNKIIKNELEFSAPTFIVDEKRDIYLAVPVNDNTIIETLDPNVCVGVDLGLAVPACCAINNSKHRKYIGRIDDFLRVRTAIQHKRKQMQKLLVMVPGGKGRDKKLKALDKYRETERNFVNTYNHMVSSAVVKFASDNDAGTIKMEFLEGFSEKDKSNFVLRNWSYYELQSMIEYKAKNKGIVVTYVDPYHTSQTCSECGHTEKDNRINQSEFKCKKCGVEINADYNAAKNISASKLFVTEKEECLYYKQTKEDNLVVKSTIRVRRGSTPKDEGQKARKELV